MSEIILKTANKTALKLLINIAIGFGLSIGWENNMLMTYWLIFALAYRIFINEYYVVIAEQVIQQIKEGKLNENHKGE